MKEHIYNNSHWYFWVFIPFIIFLSINSNIDVLDFNIHDTYYLIETNEIVFLSSFYFLLVGLGYFLIKKLNRRSSKWLTTLHTLVSLVFFVAIFISIRSLKSIQTMGFDYDGLFSYSLLYVYIIPFLLIQLLFPINIAIGFFRKE